MSNEQPRELKINDNFAGGEYSNFANISHNQEEFQLVFANVVPPAGRVVAKVLTTPAHFKRIITTMNDNLKRYEERFGQINDQPSPLDKEIGFQGN